MFKNLKITALLLVIMILFVGCTGGTTDSGGSSKDDVKEISIMTPYISSVTTNQMVNKMEELMKARGWNVSIVDTKGDVGALASRMEDVISAKTDAIVIVSTDPNQVSTQISLAASNDIPVFGCDSGFIDGMVVNATSDNYAMGEQLTNWIFNEIGEEGKIIAFTHRPHPGVIKRSNAFDDMLPNYPNIELITEKHVDVPGPIESARQSMESLLLSNPDKGSITAVWAAWDEPAIGVSQAIQAAGRDEIIVGGVDGNSQAVEMIKEGTPLKVTIAQNFEKMAEIVDEYMNKYFNNDEFEYGDVYAPAEVITK
ncbi:MAG TPA: ribose ABC transporter substrate-binding protein [Clostridiales bacterium]|jgi:ribose transport system substrate-binding protein|nr:ribose ABC transporter substrate-binding protein [Clostridiales bacterium]